MPCVVPVAGTPDPDGELIGIVGVDSAFPLDSTTFSRNRNSRLGAVKISPSLTSGSSGPSCCCVTDAVFTTKIPEWLLDEISLLMIVARIVAVPRLRMSMPRLPLSVIRESWTDSEDTPASSKTPGTFVTPLG